MANIYGVPESVQEILKSCPDGTIDFEDINRNHQDIIAALHRSNEEFFEQLTVRIQTEEATLEKIRNNKSATIVKHDNEIEKVKNKLQQDKKNRKWISVGIGSLKVLYKKYYLKPKEVKKIEISEMNKERFVSKLKERPPEVFNEEYSDLINTEERYTDVKKSPFYPGAMGELEVLAELTKLDNNYNILCGLNITLPEWHSYNGKSYNLKSAQMDLVVICRKGIFVIEVKNWSTNFYNEYRNISPYEQVSRAGRVLYLSLNRQKHLSRKLGVTTVLISIRNNMPYNSDYTHVMVLRKENITVFIKNRTDSLSQYEVDEVVDELKRYATYNQNSG